MLIDTHCHLDFSDFDPDRDLVLQNAHQAGVDLILNVASSLENSYAAVKLANAYPEVYASVGIHPHDSKDADLKAVDKIAKLSDEKKVVAIGEVGLDFYRNLSPQDIQVDIFRRFIDLALKKRLPLIVHSRLAQDMTLAVLNDYPGINDIGLVIHCFSGDEDFLKECLNRGYFVSFTCNATYKKADAIREAIRLTPMDRIFLETDAPYLSPEGKRGKRNEPANIIEIAREVARIKLTDFDTVCNQTTQNAKKFFRIS